MAAVLVAVLVAGGLAAYVVKKRQDARDIRGSPTVEFVTREEPPPAPRPRTNPILWPMYGFDERRLRRVDLPLRPPFRRVWTFHGRTLLEFPPVIGYGRLYLTNNAGTLFAVNARTGKRAWRYRARRCAASSPALAGKILVATFLYRPPCGDASSNDGEVVAFAVGFGKILWRRPIGPTESSPLVARRVAYVGDWRGDVYALRIRTGKVLWRYRTGGEIKGGLALAGNRLFVGAYDSRVYALDARTGRLLWRASAQPRLGQRGRFYSTPAAAYGRVYIGSTDGKVYSFGALSGKLRWSQGTGGYVYGSPAVWRRRVLIGSYDGTFYALDAATGDVRWRFSANGPISGSATVVGGIVYFATLNRRTYALDARNGRLLWTFRDGKYTPVVADASRLYVVGYGKLYGLIESGRAGRARRAATARYCRSPTGRRDPRCYSRRR